MKDEHIINCNFRFIVDQERLMASNMDNMKGSGTSQSSEVQFPLQRKIASDFLSQGLRGIIFPGSFQLPGEVHPNEDEHKILVGLEKLKSIHEKLHGSENEVGRLMEQLKKSQESEQALQSQLATMKDQALELADRDQEIRRLNEEITNAEKSHQEEMMKLEKKGSYLEKKVHDLEVSLREVMTHLEKEIANADKSLSEVKTYHQEEIMKSEKERSSLAKKVDELDVLCQSLNVDVGQVQTEKSALEASLKDEIEQLQTTVSKQTGHLNKITQNYDRVMDEKYKLNARVEEIITEMRSKGDRVNALHLECVKMTEEAGKDVGKLRARVEELEEKVAKQEEIIPTIRLGGAKRKRKSFINVWFARCSTICVGPDM